MAKMNYDAINFKNKDIDKFTTKFNQNNGDPKKKEPVKKEPAKKEKPDVLPGEKGNGPYSVRQQAEGNKTPNSTTGKQYRETYGPKIGYNSQDVGTLSQSDSLAINENRAPTLRNFKIVEEGLMNGIKFPGLTPEFKDSFKTYQKLPQKFK
jgi:hypothetical protein